MIPPDSGSVSAAQEVEDEEYFELRKAVLHQVLDLLPDFQRAVVVLFDLEDISYVEAAAKLGISEGTVKSRLSRARERLPDLVRLTAVSKLASPIPTVYQLLESNYDRVKSFKLRLLSPIGDVCEIPARGKNLIVVANLPNRLHFRFFEANGRKAVDADETRLHGKEQTIAQLKKRLAGVWGLTKLPRDIRQDVNIAVESIVDYVIKKTARDLKYEVKEVKVMDDWACDYLRNLDFPLPKRRG